jgi:spermidine synthase
MTLEFFEALADHLNPGGIVVSNLISSLIGDTSDLLMAEVRTVEEVLPHVYLFTTRSRSTSMVQNISLLATSVEPAYTGDELQALALDAPVKGETLARYAENLYEGELYYGDSKVLTDDYAPTESLLNPVTLSPYGWE